MNFEGMSKSFIDHATFSSVIATKTPTELKVMLRNLKDGNADHKESKIAMVEKRLLRMVK